MEFASTKKLELSEAEKTFADQFIITPSTSIHVERILEAIKRKELTGAIVYVMAPWCGHCKRSVDKVNILAHRLPVTSKATIVWVLDTTLAEMKVSQNSIVRDIAFGVSSFPTSFFITDQCLLIKKESPSSPDAMTEELWQHNPSSKEYFHSQFEPQLLEQLTHI